jgi:4-hydroxy-tetrahydrodipicolinate synthase
VGGVFLLEELLAGATGAMTGFAFPRSWCDRGSLPAGRVQDAADVFYPRRAAVRFEFQEGIGMAIRKEVLHRRGALASPATRAPGAGLDKTTREALDRVMAWVTSQKGMEWI